MRGVYSGSVLGLVGLKHLGIPNGDSLPNRVLCFAPGFFRGLFLKKTPPSLGHDILGFLLGSQNRGLSGKKTDFTFCYGGAA